MVDTGFTGSIAVSPLQSTLLKVKLFGVREEVDIADGGVPVDIGTLTIEWFGEKKIVDVHVFNEERKRRFSDPLPLLGASLLNGHKLFVDYATHTLIIR